MAVALVVLGNLAIGDTYLLTNGTESVAPTCIEVIVLVVNLDGKTGLIAYTGEPITDKISIAIQTYYNNLIKDWTSDELPSLQVYGAQRTLDDFQNEKPYISAGATKVFNEFKQDISARFPDKEFSFSIDNIWEKVADD